MTNDTPPLTTCKKHVHMRHGHPLPIQLHLPTTSGQCALIRRWHFVLCIWQHYSWKHTDFNLSINLSSCLATDLYSSNVRCSGTLGCAVWPELWSLLYCAVCALQGCHGNNLNQGTRLFCTVPKRTNCRNDLVTSNLQSVWRWERIYTAAQQISIYMNSVGFARYLTNTSGLVK